MLLKTKWSGNLFFFLLHIIYSQIKDKEHRKTEGILQECHSGEKKREKEKKYIHVFQPQAMQNNK